MDNTLIDKKCSGQVLAGAVNLSTDRVGLVFADGTVLAVHDPVVLTENSSAVALREEARALEPAAASLRAIEAIEARRSDETRAIDFRRMIA